MIGAYYYDRCIGAHNQKEEEEEKKKKRVRVSVCIRLIMTATTRRRPARLGASSPFGIEISARRARTRSRRDYKIDGITDVVVVPV